MMGEGMSSISIPDPVVPTMTVKWPLVIVKFRFLSTTVDDDGDDTVLAVDWSVV